MTLTFYKAAVTLPSPFAAVRQRCERRQVSVCVHEKCFGVLVEIQGQDKGYHRPLIHHKLWEIKVVELKIT